MKKIKPKYASLQDDIEVVTAKLDIALDYILSIEDNHEEIIAVLKQINEVGKCQD
jgi:hypothetical protein